ncbi:MAG: diguanylate cyclase [Nocardioides sp.]|uniref:GGDEF domain-containing protein n=1 Tax=Nocardioides sp. TaxID=35761 RepID=UPI0039E21636
MDAAAAIAVGLAALLAVASFARVPRLGGWIWIGLVELCILVWCWCAFVDTRDGGTSPQLHSVWFAVVALTSGSLLLFGRRAVGVAGHPRPRDVALIVIEPVLVLLPGFAGLPWWEDQFTALGLLDRGKGWAYLLHTVYCTAVIILAAAMMGRRAEFSRGALRWSLYGVIACSALGLALQATGAQLTQWAALGVGLFVHLAYAELSHDPYAAVDLADTDRLTGVLNRGGLDRMLARSIERSERFGSKLMVMVVDLDRFKSINDSHGHLCGDAVLVAVAKRLTGLVGRNGGVGRFGGDEFVLFVTGLDLAHGVAFASRALALASEPVEGPEGSLSLTVSVGMATYHGGGAARLLATADDAMYDAKRRGGNAVAVRA